MPLQRLTDLDLHLISEELEATSDVSSTALTEGGLQIQLEDHVLRLFYPVGPHREPIESEDADRVLFATGRGYLELGDKGIRYHQFPDSTDYSTLLKQIIAGEAEGRELDVSEALDSLTQAGYLPAYTSKTLGDLMAGWVVSDKDDTVLDIATGSGSHLQQAAEHTDGSQLVGIEIQPLVAKLARKRLNDVESAEIVNQDFFDWRVPRQQELSGASQDNEVSEKFDAVIGDPPMGRLVHPDAEGRERIQEWAPGRGKSASPAFVTKAVSHLKEGGRGAFLLPKSALKHGLLEQLSETCGIHRIVELPAGSLNDAHSVELVLLTLIKEERSRSVRETGIAKFNQMELPDSARGLFEQPLDQILKNRYNPYNAEIARASNEDLKGRNVM